jgi:hypothetical protein
MKTNVIDNLSGFWLPALETIFFTWSERLLIYLGFQYLDYEGTLWRLFQKLIVCTKVDIYVVII